MALLRAVHEWIQVEEVATLARQRNLYRKPKALGWSRYLTSAAIGRTWRFKPYSKFHMLSLGVKSAISSWHRGKSGTLGYLRALKRSRKKSLFAIPVTNGSPKLWLWRVDSIKGGKPGPNKGESWNLSNLSLGITCRIKGGFKAEREKSLTS